MTEAEMYARGYSDALSVKTAGSGVGDMMKEIGKQLFGAGLLSTPKAVKAFRHAHASPRWNLTGDPIGTAKFLWNNQGFTKGSFGSSPRFGTAVKDMAKGTAGLSTTVGSLLGLNAMFDGNPDPLPPPTAEELAAHAKPAKGSSGKTPPSAGKSAFGSMSPGAALAIAATLGIGGGAGIYALYNKLRKDSKKKKGSKTVEVG